MMNLKFILLILILEIISFILFGDILGFFPVLFLIFLTFIIGLLLIRSNINLKDIENLIHEPNQWIYKKIAGILLIIPGFITDFLGLGKLSVLSIVLSTYRFKSLVKCLTFISKEISG